mgnify:CR=1 FL=1
MNKNTKSGLLALGLVAAAAWYKMTPEQKASVKNKISGLGNKLKENLPENLKNVGQEIKNSVTRKTNQVEDQLTNN